MQSEFDVLVRNQTWELVPMEPSQNVVDCRWIFCIKYHSNGTIDCYEAHLIAKGFT